ncbi:hypothetical protein [Pannonibacter tanglangensis]|uniref:Uncharacterized protein n=1 Tax=Pannonibacter tanglangensis TaxID=2750084 RepID=A0ABW9ZJ54_9HYPH|nr:hypothetical protein [Pannonibacter sp. XCT-34]NBN62760.1 hypothetical protein [Pannonibacter sp. XCT-34]
MSAKYFTHITLNNGHTAKQPRSEISDQVVVLLHELFDSILQGGHPQLFNDPRYLLSGTHAGSNLIVTLWRGPWDTRVPILTMGTALKSRSSRRLWEAMHADTKTKLATDPATPPPVPWQADRIEVSAFAAIDAMQWSGDMSRCIAWAWAEYSRANSPD